MHTTVHLRLHDNQWRRWATGRDIRVVDRMDSIISKHPTGLNEEQAEERRRR